MSDVLDLDAPENLEGEPGQEQVRSITVPFELRASAEGDGLTLTGYAAVFNTPTRISDWDGDYTEEIAPGAFRKTLRERTPVIQFDHGQHPVLGSIPIAAIRSLKEDRTGLFLEARLFDNWMTEPLQDAIREQAISGMSFRFSVVKDEWSGSGKNRSRLVKEVRLYELGPVVHPAYSDTSVALRSLSAHLPDLSNLLSTSRTEAAPEGTPVEAAATQEPAEPSSHSRTHNQRRAIALLALRK